MTRKMFGICMVGVVVACFFGSLVGFPVFAEEGPADIEIVEVIDDSTGEVWHDITDAMPGEVYGAIPRVKNNGSVDVNVRMCISRSGNNRAGEAIEVTNEHISVNLEPGWTKEEGAECYDYDSVLAVGESTAPLFSSISINNLGNEHQGATFSLHLDAFAVGGSPDEESGETGGPSSPDTGAANGSEALTRPAAIGLAVGAAILISMTIYLIANSMRKK